MATIATPTAATIAPMIVPMPIQVSQSPEHWRSVNAKPIRPPHNPATRIETKAMPRARGEGKAERTAIRSPDSDVDSTLQWYEQTCDNQKVKPFTVAGAILSQGPDLLLVCNQRRNGSHDWSPPGGIVDPGETVLDGLTREVEEETQLKVTEWGDRLYEVSVDFVHLEWRLKVEVFEAVAWSGALHVDDPDGVVIDASFVAHDNVGDQVAASPEWVREPLLGWHNTRDQTSSPGTAAMSFRVDRGADKIMTVTRES